MTQPVLQASEALWVACMTKILDELPHLTRNGNIMGAWLSKPEVRRVFSRFSPSEYGQVRGRSVIYASSEIQEPPIAIEFPNP